MAHYPEISDRLESKIEELAETSHSNNINVPSEAQTALICFDSNNEELYGKISTMIEPINVGEYKYKCTVCGKTGKNRQSTTIHVESHLQGVSHPCKHCGKLAGLVMA